MLLRSICGLSPGVEVPVVTLIFQSPRDPLKLATSQVPPQEEATTVAVCPLPSLKISSAVAKARGVATNAVTPTASNTPKLEKLFILFLIPPRMCRNRWCQDEADLPRKTRLNVK